MKDYRVLIYYSTTVFKLLGNLYFIIIINKTSEGLSGAWYLNVATKKNFRKGLFCPGSAQNGPPFYSKHSCFPKTDLAIEPFVTKYAGIIWATLMINARRIW